MIDDAEERVSPSFEELWATARRRRWWLLLPLFFCWLTVWGVSWLLPSTYESQATILVEQQKVPEHFVTPNVTVNLQDRLQSMTQQILSRTRLQKTIDDLHLYSPLRGLGRLFQSGDSVEQMRKDIKIELVQSQGRPADLTAFKIYYSGTSPSRAQQVNSELTTLFIDENVRSEQQSSQDTTTFLASQLEDARNKLEQQEAKVKAFKASRLGELPSQMESNVKILTGLQTQLESILRALDNAKQQKLYLDSQLQQFQSASALLVSGDADATSPETLDRELFTLRQRLADERSRHTDEYPEIIALKRKIAEAEKLKKDMDLEIAEKEKANQESPTDGLSATYSSPLMQLRSQLKANALEIQNYQHREKTIEVEISAYKARLNMTPETEQELADISRGYEESRANYNSLLQKQNQSQLATSLSQRQQGEQFRVLDPPSLPDKPATPNHLLWSLGGLVLGGVVALGLILFLELNNVRVRQEKDLSQVVPARVLVCIPHLGTPQEAQFAVALRRLEFVTALAMVLVMVAGNFYAFFKG
jgi:polysaccharide chain length determinant protein (PEP-CTERM system associated)